MAGLQKYFIESENIGIYEQILENVSIVDAHAHVGVDRDGHKLTASSLLKLMDENDINRAVIFPLNDPNAGKTFSFPNDRILSSVRRNKGRFIPFFRLDPNHDWKPELSKRVSQGFAGLKLHPLSQRFRIASSEAMRLYGELEKNNLILLLHGGFGVDGIASDLLKVSRKFRNLRIIVGHGGFGELDETIKLLADRPNVVFDTSAMRFFDLVELLMNVSYRKIVFGSDIPYYDQTLSLQMLIDSAAISKHSPGRIKSMLGGNLEKWLK